MAPAARHMLRQRGREQSCGAVFSLFIVGIVVAVASAAEVSPPPPPPTPCLTVPYSWSQATLVNSTWTSTGVAPGSHDALLLGGATVAGWRGVRFPESRVLAQTPAVCLPQFQAGAADFTIAMRAQLIFTAGMKPVNLFSLSGDGSACDTEAKLLARSTNVLSLVVRSSYDGLSYEGPLLVWQWRTQSGLSGADGQPWVSPAECSPVVEP